MKKVLEEIGKGLINFANIITALVFIKDYIIKDHNSSLIYGVIFWILFYVLGSSFIKKSEEIKNG
ncbi:MAG TPA: hypothetical protein EYH54_02195 [Nautiliaceae bacterium]|nr:hypothetical protein [Nautiliaceae bacterium]